MTKVLVDKKELVKLCDSIIGNYYLGESEEQRLIRTLVSKAQDLDKVDAQPAGLTEVERKALDGLLKVAEAAFYVSDDSEDDGGELIKVLRKSSENLSDALDELECSLPDDRPGYTLGPSSRAEWALRRLLDLDSQPVPAMAGDDLSDAEVVDLAVDHFGIDADRMPYNVVNFARALLKRVQTASGEDV
jgi:hypothetical protein